ncbi:MAG: hypothetical protein NT157_04790 [Candidatus Micrarchaeota archaeon]|nr:hypothetical protein [Candidatus Micrarchaeota archaeon]
MAKKKRARRGEAEDSLDFATGQVSIFGEKIDDAEGEQPWSTGQEYGGRGSDEPKRETFAEERQWTGPGSEEQPHEEMADKEVYGYKRGFAKKVIYADRPAYEKRSDNLARESWSYHSMFPSMRTFVPLVALPVSSFVIRIFGLEVGPKTSAALWSLVTIAFIIAVIFFFAEMTKHRASHALKDGLIHVAVLLLLLFMSGSLESAVKVFLLYMGAHWLLHSVDFHVERSPNRMTMAIVAGGILVFVELLLAVWLFDPGLTKV